MTVGDYLQSPLNAAPRLAKGTFAEGHDACGPDQAAFAVFWAKHRMWDFGTGLLSTASSFIVALCLKLLQTLPVRLTHMKSFSIKKYFLILIVNLLFLSSSL